LEIQGKDKPDIDIILQVKTKGLGENSHSFGL
jgi:hypothetical protein